MNREAKARIELLSEDELRSACEQIELPDLKERFGFVPNSTRILARRPDILRAFFPLVNAIMGSGELSVSLKNMIAEVSSKAGGCLYCQAHAAHTSSGNGISSEKEADLWNFETSPHFSQAEKAALRIANQAALVPNMVTDEDFDELRRHYSNEQIVEIVAVISLFGFLNRLNDTMATPLEEIPLRSASMYHGSKGWSPGKHS